MGFSKEVVDQAWARSDGKCERCGKELFERSRQGSKSEYGWEAHQKKTGKDYTVENCEIRCHLCYKAASSAKYN